jgi:hypothetical protein
MIGQHNTTQHNTTQHNTTQHNTTQHNTTRVFLRCGILYQRFDKLTGVFVAGIRVIVRVLLRDYATTDGKFIDIR